MVDWEAPGRGRWELELSHFGGRFTPWYRAVYAPAMAAGMASSLERYGVVVRTLEMRFVHDRPYMRIMPLTELPRVLATRPPPLLLAWLLTRLVPEMRRRRRKASAAFESRLWRSDGDRWENDLKAAAVARNLSLQSVDLAAADDAGLARHLRDVADNLAAGVWQHFDLVAPSSAPLGDFIATARDEWGMAPTESLGLLQGSSPASAEVAEWLQPVARAAAAAPRMPTDLDGLRALGQEAAEALDHYLDHFGWRNVAGFDVDYLSLGEQPGVIVSSVAALARGRTSAGDPGRRITAARERVPPADGARFDDLLAEARYGYGIRDDNSGITLHWPAGLARRALLEAGRRLQSTGHLDVVGQVCELLPEELDLLFTGGGPSLASIRERTERRRANNQLDAPRFIGPPEPLPPLGPVPAPLRRMGKAMLVLGEMINSAEERTDLVGTGIGTTSFRGIARVARTPEEALRDLEPGDVLVAPLTTPAYNSVLPIVGGLVVEEGGALSHAAIVARELGIPAVIGAAGATTRITSGQEVEIDPVAGEVRVV